MDQGYAIKLTPAMYLEPYFYYSDIGNAIQSAIRVTVTNLAGIFFTPFVNHRLVMVRGETARDYPRNGVDSGFYVYRYNEHHPSLANHQVLHSATLRGRCRKPLGGRL